MVPRSHTARRGTVPAERSSFVGRRPEAGEVRRLLESSRLVTLVGPGGVGKTRLATRVATTWHRSFPAGVVLAELGGVRDPALVALRVAEALDLHDASGGWLVGRLVDRIADGRLLLVLDNCEHLVDACGVLVDALLGGCAHLRVLATSRHPLGIEGEAVLAVPPLATPPPGGAGDALAYDAVRLLVDRARSAVPGLELDPADVAALAELSRRLDGLPLAIELAAVRLRVLSPRELLARLDDSLRLFSRSGSAVTERHRSLRATMEWSYGLLDPTEQLLWTRLAVFAGPFDTAAAEEVCADADLPRDGVLDALTGLVEASVLDVLRVGGAPRFRMLETVRSFGLEKLTLSGGRDGAHARHVRWYADEAAAAAAAFSSPTQPEVLDRLEAEHAELSAALVHCLRAPGLHEVGLSMASDLWLYWGARGHLTEGRRLVAELLSACPEEAPARARGLAVAGYLALGALEPEAAVPLLGEALALAADRSFTTALATQYLGLAALFRRDLSGAETLLHRAADLHRAIDRRYAAFCMADIGLTALLLRDSPERASSAFAEALELNEGGDPWTRSHALWGLGLARLVQDEPGDARRLTAEALDLMRVVDDRSGVARCVEAMSWVAAAEGQWDRAAVLAGAAEATWRAIPAELPAPLVPFRERFATRARHALGGSRWSALRLQGNALDRSEAVAAALGERRDTAPPARREHAGTLTPRQLQVAALVAEGLTDREIATRLVISPRTAESHVEQILSRLGLRNRAEVAAWTTARA